MTRQDQNVGEGGNGIQAGGNVSVTHGLTPEQMLMIMEGISNQVQRGVDQAAAMVSDRLKEFEQSVIGEFAKSDTKGNTEAFRDPDFQYALHEAQKGFVRSGEEGLKEELVKLLAQRSAEPGRTRVALALNEAIKTIGSLTKEEISALVVVFVFHNIQINNPGGISEVISQYKNMLSAFIDDFPEEDFAFEYLSSMRCIAINQFSTVELWKVIIERYENIFTRGFSEYQLPSGLKPPVMAELVEQIPLSIEPKLRFRPKNSTDLGESLIHMDLADDVVAAVQSLYSSSKLPSDEVMRIFAEQIPGISKLLTRWDSTIAKNAQLTGLGKAIAHSALTSRTNFSAPISIWVK